MSIPTTNGHSHEPVGSPIRDPIYQPQRKLKVIVIGAGASGLLLAYKLQRHFDNLDLKVFEKHPAVSGVWFESVGGSLLSKQCTRRCSLLMTCRRTQDALVTFLLIVSEYFRIGKALARSSLAVGYTWSFEPKTDWSANYATASEIRQYFTDFCSHHDLQKYISLEHLVLGAEWSEDDAEWRVNVRNLRTNRELRTTAHVLISATGILNKWSWPLIPGLHSFKGKLLHSAAWDKSVDLSDKTVGLIGNGYDPRTPSL